MESTLLPFEAHPKESGITLLEAYSALANKAPLESTAIDIPTPGMTLSRESESDFWHLQLRTSA